ncbi:MAG: hypothetical protein E6R08_00925 [Nevskiaceae bacterium]|nr:MAG: hypothetical protein E6R08_00925 [Nevskiaceae bacterium]
MKVGVVALVISMIVAVPVGATVSEQRELEEARLAALKDHCDGLLSARLNASRNERWREVFNTAKSFADACRGQDSKFAVSRAYEDMGWASMMLDDPRMGLNYLTQCIDGNGFAGGCYARKTQILLMMGKNREASATAWKGLARTERAIAIAKQAIASLKRPDPRAENYWRVRYLRQREELDTRISALEESRTLLQQLNEDFDQ